jgi:ribosomal protein S18 acetylase RimI-like enzyme
MRIRPFVARDLPRLIDLTVETFGPFFEESFRPLVGDTVFANESGDWRADYHREVPTLHDPDRHRFVAVAEVGTVVAGFIAWNVDPQRHNGCVTHVAVSAAHRRLHLGTALCGHAFDAMRALGAEVVRIGTGGDPFHAPARALYESLGCTPLPLVTYYRQL